MNNLLLYFLLIASIFLVGMATGIIISRFTTEKKERDYLHRMEVLGFRNNEILDEVRQVVSFNNKLASENREFKEKLDTFIREWV